jgi:ribonuclease T2
VRSARDQVAIPEIFAHASTPQRASPADIVRAFEAANPRLRPGMMAVGCTRGVLQEVRICFSKDLRAFRPCPEVVRNSCRGGDIAIPPAL